MKLKAFLPVAAIAVLASIMYLSSCSVAPDPDSEGGNEGGGEETGTTSEEADQLLSTVVLTTGTKITGTVPPVANTEQIKVNREDTIYTMPNVKMPIRFSHPEGVVIGGFFVTTENATYYYDATLVDEEDSDTVSIAILEIVPDTRPLPYTITIKVVPYDDSKTPVDITEFEVTVEDPEASPCDLLVETSTRPWEWIWMWTMTFDPNGTVTFINSPRRKFSTWNDNITGCCNDLAACPAYVVDPNTGQGTWKYNATVSAETAYWINEELFNFFSDGTFARHTSETKKNFDPIETDWCNSHAAYTAINDRVNYYGTHNYTPGSSSITYATQTKECDDPLGICGYGSRGGDVAVTCNNLMITIDRLKIDFTKEVRMYVRSPGSTPWKS